MGVQWYFGLANTFKNKGPFWGYLGKLLFFGPKPTSAKWKNEAGANPQILPSLDSTSFFFDTLGSWVHFSIMAV